MTYRLEPIIEKIHSPVIIVLPDGTLTEYRSGTEAAASAFDKRYVIRSLSAVGDKIQIDVTEARMPDTTWIGEEQTFF